LLLLSFDEGQGHVMRTPLLSPHELLGAGP
jgi:hypothetical protein